MLITSTVLGLFFPLLASVMINSKTHQAAFDTAMLMVGILLAQGIMSYFQSFLFNTLGEYGLSDLRKRLFNHLTEMPMTFFSQQQVGELTSRMFADLTQLQDAFVMAVPQFLRQSIIMVGSMGMMFYISPQLTGVHAGLFSRRRLSARSSSGGWSEGARARRRMSLRRQPTWWRRLSKASPM